MDKKELIFKPISLINGDDELKNFSCGNTDMDSFLVCEARNNHLISEASTNLILYNQRLLGYFTLKRDFIRFDDQSIRPCLNIERLAVAQSNHRQGIASHVLDILIDSIDERYIAVDAYVKYKDLYAKRNFIIAISDEAKRSQPDDLIYMYVDLVDKNRFLNGYNISIF